MILHKASCLHEWHAKHKRIWCSDATSYLLIVAALVLDISLIKRKLWYSLTVTHDHTDFRSTAIVLCICQKNFPCSYSWNQLYFILLRIHVAHCKTYLENRIKHLLACLASVKNLTLVIQQEVLHCATPLVWMTLSLVKILFNLCKYKNVLFLNVTKHKLFHRPWFQRNQEENEHGNSLSYNLAPFLISLSWKWPMFQEVTLLRTRYCLGLQN